jgi:hypothetical protein
MSTRDRIPLATRLLRPRYAREVTDLADALRRSGHAGLPPDARGAVELGYEAGRHGRIDRGIARRAPRVHRAAEAGRRSVRRARAVLAELALADGALVVLDGRPMTVGQLRHRLTAVGAAVDADTTARRLDRGSRWLRAVGIGLLLIDAIALVIIFAFLLNLDWHRPDPANLVTAVALALFGAAVQAVLALHLGRRLWAWRHTDPDDDGATEFPPRSAPILLGGGLLGVVSTFAAGAIFLRVQREGVVAEAGPLATALGLVLAASAIAAPWCLVSDEAYAPGPGQRMLRAGARILLKVERRRRRAESRVRADLVRAAHRLGRAEWLMAAALHRVGADQLAVHGSVLDARGRAWPHEVYRAADLATAHHEAHLAWPDRPGGRDAGRSTLPVMVPIDDRPLVLPVGRLRDELAEARTDYLGITGAAVLSGVDLAG